MGTYVDVDEKVSPKSGQKAERGSALLNRYFVKIAEH